MCTALARPGVVSLGMDNLKGDIMIAESLNSLEPVTNGARQVIEMSIPYTAEVLLEGICPLLFHRWNCEEVEAKSKAKKGSKAKKEDNIESYVYRCEDGTVGIPGVYLTNSITNPQNGAAKYLQDPRSPRKSALDLYKAGIFAQTELASLNKTIWDYIDQRRVVIQRSAITRNRPAFNAGWTATFLLQVVLPEYIAAQDLHQVLVNAGRLVGIGDYRPTYGRFNVINFNILQ